MTQVFIRVLAAALGTLGFGVLFNLRGKKLIVGALGGMFAWLLFEVLGGVVQNEPIRYFIVSAAASVYAEVFARGMKTPRTTFWIVNLIPLIPGGSLYYTMSSAVESDFEIFMQRGIYTLELAAALSLGIVTVAAFSRLIKKKHTPHTK
jgi:uncharacterized membrane protein YjjB (DUF3815 family)